MSTRGSTRMAMGERRTFSCPSSPQSVASWSERNDGVLTNQKIGMGQSWVQSCFGHERKPIASNPVYQSATTMQYPRLIGTYPSMPGSDNKMVRHIDTGHAGPYPTTET